MSRYYPTENPASAAAQEQLQQLKALFAGYQHDSEELYRNQEVNVSETFKRYLNMDDLRNSPIHKKFYLDTQACVQELADCLKQAPSSLLAHEAVSLFLREKRRELEPAQRSWLIAAEALSIPLLGYLSKEDAGELCAAYEQQYDWVELLPKQRELYNALCLAAGRKPRKTGLFSRLFITR